MISEKEKRESAVEQPPIDDWAIPALSEHLLGESRQVAAK
jgi:hypothetical protein